MYKPTNSQLRLLKQYSIPLNEIKKYCKGYTDVGGHQSGKDFIDFVNENRVLIESSTKEHTYNHTDNGLMTKNWMPSQEIMLTLEKSGADLDLIKHQITLFRLYWISKREARSNWDSVFIGRMSHLQPMSNAPKRRSIHEMLTDRSWADGL
jgi:hypothetical protein